MRKTVLLGVMIGGIVLIALSQSGVLLPNTPCNDSPTPPTSCVAPFPLAVYIALVSGAVLLAASFLLYRRDGRRRQEVRAETR
jgi:hypothetical protein